MLLHLKLSLLEALISYSVGTPNWAPTGIFKDLVLVARSSD